MVLLPLIILVAFQFDNGGDDNGGGEFGSLIDLATSGGLNFTRGWCDNPPKPANHPPCREQANRWPAMRSAPLVLRCRDHVD
jgi:hypothetical protein